jgi:hypothetical protein
MNALMISWIYTYPQIDEDINIKYIELFLLQLYFNKVANKLVGQLI